MDIYDLILENLELERELGTRMVEIDRALLVPPERERPKPPHSVAPGVAAEEASGTPRPSAATAEPQRQDGQVRQAPPTQSIQSTQSIRSAPPIQSTQPIKSTRSAQPAPSSIAAPAGEAPECDIAFFTGRPLSEAGAEAMRKTFAAIGKIRPDARLAMNERRRARVIVMLGSDAMKKWLPTARPIRGAWQTIDGVPAITTFSPDFIFTHFQPDSPHMNAAKRDMWNDIKSAVARLG